MLKEDKFTRQQFQIGHTIKLLRERNKLTLEQLGVRSGVSAATICRTELGDIADNHLSTVCKLAQALDVSICVLLGEDHPPAKPESQVIHHAAQILDRFAALPPMAQERAHELVMGVLDLANARSG